MCSPLLSSASDSALNDWANAHSRLLAEEARLVDLCRRLAGSKLRADELATQRQRVAQLREFSEALYVRAMEILRSPSG